MKKLRPISNFSHHPYSSIPAIASASTPSPVATTTTDYQGKSLAYLKDIDETLHGIKTTIPFHLQLMDNEQFRAGNFTTKFLEDFDLLAEE